MLRWMFFISLVHYDLVMPRAVKDFDQDIGLSWWHQAISYTNIGMS